MASEGSAVDRLREYLRELTPQTHAMLVGALERSLMRDEEVPGCDLVLRELRRSMRHGGQALERIDHSARLFFRPFEPFLVDDIREHRHCCRIARSCLEPMWAWIGRDALPAETKAYSQSVELALAGNDLDRAEQLADDFRDRVAAAMAETVAQCRADAKAIGRLTVSLGSRRALSDLDCAIAILRHRHLFDDLNVRLPGHIKVLVDPQLTAIRELLETALQKRPKLLPYGFILVMNRMEAPWQLIRFAVRAADSDAAGRIAATPDAIAVTIVLDEVERMVRELRTELKSGRGIAVISLLKAIHDASRGLNSEIDLSVDTEWGRQLATIRSEISQLVKTEIEAMPGLVRRLLRPRPAAEVAPGQVLDADDVTEAETLIGFVDACRHFGGELAISEMTLRAIQEVQAYLASDRPALLEALANAGERDRAYRRSQIDAAVRLSEKLGDGEDAAAFAKAAADIAGTGRQQASA